MTTSATTVTMETAKITCAFIDGLKMTDRHTWKLMNVSKWNSSSLAVWSFGWLDRVDCTRILVTMKLEGDCVN